MLEDKSKEELSEDDFGRDKIVETLVQVINNVNANEHTCFTIGIFAKWGEGKTSVLNFLKNELEQSHKYDVTVFNPWFFKDQESLMFDFFNTIKKNKGDDTIAAIKKYAPMACCGLKSLNTLASHLLVPLTSGVSYLTKPLVDKGIDSISDFISNIPEITESVKERKEKLNDLFKRTKNIIVIDDVDRLDKEEMHAVFNLIKQTADFDNTIYIVAMDRDIVAKSLCCAYGNGEESVGYEFLEKVFQLQLYLPKVQSHDLYKIFEKGLADVLNVEAFKTPEKQLEIKNAKEKFKTYILPTIKSARQIKQIVNILLINIPLIGIEVDICDLVLLNSLKIVYPKGYDIIRNNKLRVVGGLTGNERLMSYKKKSENLEQKKFNEEVHDDFVLSVKKSISEEGRPYIEELIDYLLKLSQNIDIYVESKRLTSENNFEKYFLLDTPDSEMSYEEIYGDFFKRIDAESQYENLVHIYNGVIIQYGDSELKRALRLIIQKYLDNTINFQKIKEICVSLSTLDNNIDDLNLYEAKKSGWHAVIEDNLNRMTNKAAIKSYPNPTEKLFETLNEIQETTNGIVLLNILSTMIFHSCSYIVNDLFKQICIDCMHKIIDLQSVEHLLSYSPSDLYQLLKIWKLYNFEDYNKVILTGIRQNDFKIMDFLSRHINQDQIETGHSFIFDLFDYEYIHQKINSANNSAELDQNLKKTIKTFNKIYEKNKIINKN